MTVVPYPFLFVRIRILRIGGDAGYIVRCGIYMDGYEWLLWVVRVQSVTWVAVVGYPCVWCWWLVAPLYPVDLSESGFSGLWMIYRIGTRQPFSPSPQPSPIKGEGDGGCVVIYV